MGSLGDSSCLSCHKGNFINKVYTGLGAGVDFDIDLSSRDRGTGAAGWMSDVDIVSVVQYQAPKQDGLTGATNAEANRTVSANLMCMLFGSVPTRLRDREGGLVGLMDDYFARRKPWDVRLSTSVC
jgi:hypothetical protein